MTTVTMPDIGSWKVAELRKFCDENGIVRKPRTPVSALRARVTKHLMEQAEANVVTAPVAPVEPEIRSAEVEKAIKQARHIMSTSLARVLIDYIEKLEARVAVDG